METPKYLSHLSRIKELSPAEQSELKPVTDRFVFRSNEYYQSLIDWNDPDDPIRRIIMPDKQELDDWGVLDASDEESYTVVPGLEHKYPDTALLLVNEVCGGYCRFCFRKRLFMDDNDEVVKDITEGLKYIREHKEITNVLLTGGDPLVMSTPKLERVVRQIREIEHVSIIRMGTKMPAFNPARILNDPSLPEMVEKYTTPRKKLYFMLHFNHPREITDEAAEAVFRLQKAGAATLHQSPLIRGVNDDPSVLADLFRKMSFVGVHPYYMFQCRPTIGNKGYTVPLEEGFLIFRKAQSQVSGVAGHSRFVMSHSTGKIQVQGMTETHVFMRYHRAFDPADRNRQMVFKRNRNAHWLEDYLEPKTSYPWKGKGATTNNQTARTSPDCSGVRTPS
jgi:KamA family protein